ALDGCDPAFAEQLDAAVRVGSEADHVAQAVEHLGAAAAGIAHRFLERNPVAVDLAEERRAHLRPPPQLLVRIPSSMHVWQVSQFSRMGCMLSASPLPRRALVCSTSIGQV